VRRWVLMIAALALVSSLLAVSSAPSATRAGGQAKLKAAATPFVVNTSGAPATLDPAEAAAVGDAGFGTNLYVTLTQLGTKKTPNGFLMNDYNKVLPYLATKWSSHDGGRTWTFTLRKGAVFPDGKPMDANAVKYSLDRNIKLGGFPSIAMNINGPVGSLFASVDAPNATTVVIHLTKPWPLYPEVLASPQLDSIVEPSIVEANGGVVANTPNLWMASHSAGGGPYLLKSYDPNSHAVLVANPRFFGPKPFEKTVIVNFISSDTTLLLQASAGKADVTINMATQTAASLRGKSCCTIAANDVPVEQFLSLPNKYPPFDNATFRKALAYAVPYKGIVTAFLAGYAKTYYGPYPPSDPIFNPALGQTHEFSIKKAKQLIQQSGVKLPVSLDLIVRNSDLTFQQIAPVIQREWSLIGVNINIKVVTPAAYIAARSTTGVRTWSLLVQFGGGLVLPFWVPNYDLRCGHINNTSNYCNPQVDTAMDKAVTAPPKVAQPLWDQIAKLWIAAAPRIPLYSAQYLAVVKKGDRHYYYSAYPLTTYLWGR
jgi:peptide/nickel transport system substrate-binding protein